MKYEKDIWSIATFGKNKKQAIQFFRNLSKYQKRYKSWKGARVVGVEKTKGIRGRTVLFKRLKNVI